MKTMRIVPAVGAILLFAAAAHAEPQAMNDSDLARIVGGESHSNTMFGPSGGVINTGDSNVDISEGGNVALTDWSQQYVTAIEVINSAQSGIGGGTNISALGFGLSGRDAASLTSAHEARLTTDQSNIVHQSSAERATATTLDANTTAVMEGTRTRDFSSFTASGSQANFTIDVPGIASVSVPTGSNIAIGGALDATLTTFSFGLTLPGALPDINISGPTVDVDLEAGGCYGGGCSASVNKDESSRPDVQAVAVPLHQGSDLSAGVIAFGSGENVVAVDRQSRVNLDRDAQENLTALKSVNAASSLVGHGTNISVTRCCRVDYSGSIERRSLRRVTQTNVITGRF